MLLTRGSWMLTITDSHLAKATPVLWLVVSHISCLRHQFFEQATFRSLQYTACTLAIVHYPQGLSTDSQIYLYSHVVMVTIDNEQV